MSVSFPVLPGFLGRIALISKIKSSAIPALVFGVALAALISCSPAASPSKSAQTADSSLSDQPSIDAISPLPPSADRPLQPGQTATDYLPNGLPALAPSKGINADQLFAERISSDDARFKRLENAVVDLRREFDAVKPAIVRLSAVESDMEELVTQLQSLTGPTPPSPAPPSSANINDSTQIPDIGPMSDSTANELLEGEPKPAKHKTKTADASPVPTSAETQEKAQSPPPKSSKRKDAVDAIIAPPKSLGDIADAKIVKSDKSPEKPVTTPVAPKEAPKEYVTGNALSKAMKAPALPLKIESIDTAAGKNAHEKEATKDVVPVIALAPKTSAPIVAQFYENEAQKSEAREKNIKTPLKVDAAPEITAPRSSPLSLSIEPLKMEELKGATPAPTVAPVPAPAPAPAPVAAAPSVPTIKGVRVAAHDDKTRIVIDANGKTPYTYNIDNSEHLLMIELPNVAWSGAQGGAAKSPLVSNWTVSQDGGTAILAITLKNNADVASVSALPGSGETPYRIVFDLKTSP